MPRKVGNAPYSKFDLRITPTDQLPIVDWSLLDVSEKYMVFQEGGEGTTKKLHYHVYVEGNISESWLKKQCAVLGRATDLQKGNVVFKCGLAHEHTIGYIVKERLCVCRKGIEEKVLDEYYMKSKDYAKGLETARRKESRRREHTLDDVFNSISADDHPDAETIVKKVLELCHEQKVRLPTRSQMETRVMAKMYPYYKQFVDSFYCQIFYPRI